MPNTLAHFALHGLATRAVVRGAELQWIYVGCVIPDLPWILQRIVRETLPHVDLYDLRLYAIAQSSLLVCLLLGGALASVSRAPLRVWLILSLGSALHLALDACQTKIANGVHLVAPFSWELLNLGLFWPEGWPTLALTVTGLVYFVVAWLRPGQARTGPLFRFGPRLVALCALFATLWLVAPLALLAGPERADSHYVRTLRDRETRTGKAVGFDRGTYLHGPEGGRYRTFAGEILDLEAVEAVASGTASLRGRFLDPDTVLVEEFHDHSGWPRDLASYLGLLLVGSAWGRWWLARARQARGSGSGA